MRKIKKGFTLIEIIIVIILLAILAAIIYPKYLDLRDEAHLRKDEIVINSLKVGIWEFYAKYKRFPGGDLTQDEHAQRDEVLSCLQEGLPDGWLFDGENGYYLIRCDGLPSNKEIYAFWSYDAFTGTIEGGEHEP
ncbi:MAG: prepilin-type N-terminal cleavage/methylation domain-containing protein [Caldisericia bacterium]